MLGKQKCRMLKEIRQRIADENDIPYVTRECRFQGECRGTCPRCEAELKYLEQQLALRASLGKRVTVAALCAGMTFAAAGCAPFGGTNEPEPIETDLTGMVAYVEESPTPTPEIEIETGEVAWPEDEPTETPPPEQVELTGDVYYPEGENG